MLILYFVIGVAAKVCMFPQEEIFPIYSWALFSSIPTTAYRYDVVIHSAKGTPLKKSLFYTEAGTYVPHPQKIAVFVILQAWGKAIAKNDVSMARKQQAIFESIYLYPNTTYQLVNTRYNPLTRWKTKQAKITEYLTSIIEFNRN